MSVHRLSPTSEPGPEPECGTADTEKELTLVDFSSGKIAMGIGYSIWLIMVAANAYVIISLAMGKGG
jgi:metal iron transporter